ncbi:MAG: hypothetical protein BJ554DRAFT_1417, partial [Olpidium bornovanus]
VVFSNLRKIFLFAQKNIFGDNAAAAAAFGEWVHDALLGPAIVEKYLPRIVPENPQALREFENVAHVIRDFERTLETAGFTKKAVLSAFIDDINEHYVRRKRETLLLGARTIMLNDDYELFPVDSAFGLFHATRDLFDLFRAVVPVYHEATLSSVPALAGLFHNDCLYIAKQLLALGHRHSSWLRAEAEEDPSEARPSEFTDF